MDIIEIFYRKFVVFVFFFFFAISGCYGPTDAKSQIRSYSVSSAELLATRFTLEDSLSMTEDEILRDPPGFSKEGGYWYMIFHTDETVQAVSIKGDFTGWDEAPVPLERSPSGDFWYLKGTDALFRRPPSHGDFYKLQLTNGRDTWEVQDPAARWVESSNLAQASRVLDSDTFEWTDNDWQRPGWEYYFLYELHASRFTERNQKDSPFLEIAEELDHDGTNDYLNNLGITAIQLLPVHEYAGDNSWGYGPSFFYAIESSYGTPNDLKEMVNTAHHNGIAVFLDVVYNHGGNTDNILWDIDAKTYYDGDTVWGPLVNYDNPIARHFFIHNLAYLMKEYHIDGFRVDGTSVMQGNDNENITTRGSGGGWEFLKLLRNEAKNIDSRVLLIAEDIPPNWYLTREVTDFALDNDSHGPFDAQWNSTFHYGLSQVIEGGDLGYLNLAFTSFGDSWHDAINYAESHDSAASPGGRIVQRARDGKGWEMSQIAAASTLFSRGIPMFFMGQEAGEGRRFDVGSAGADEVLPLNEYEKHNNRRKILDWHRRMFEIRKRSLHSFSSGDIAITHLNDSNGVVAFTRDNGKYLVVLNFKGTNWWNYDVGVSGLYKELANTTWDAFNFTGNAFVSRGGESHHHLSSVHIPAYGAVVFERY